MSWMLRLGIWTVPLFAVLLLPLLWLELHGFTADAVTEMWARAIVQIEGPQVFRATEAFYPPLPYTIALMAQTLLPESALPVPTLIAAAVAAVMLYAWFWNLRDRGAFDALSALLIVILLAMNPVFLRALADGPSTMFLLLGFWIYARGLLNLRLNGAAPDMMKVAVGLLIMPLSHGYGILLALGTLPFIVIAARPSMLVASSLGYLVSMFFPVTAALGSLLFVSAVLKTEFFSEQLVLDGAPAASVALLPSVATLIVVAAVLIRTVWMPRFFLPLLAAAGSMIGGATLNIVYGFESDPVVVAAPALGLAVVAVRSWPPSAWRAPIVAALLAVSVFPAGIWANRVSGSTESTQFLRALGGAPVADASAADRAVAEFLRGRSGILADVERHPRLVTALGDVEGFLVAGDPAYDLAIQSGRPRGSYIAVRVEPGSVVQSDRLLRAFPRLAEDNDAPPFVLRYDHDGWRVFEIAERD